MALQKVGLKLLHDEGHGWKIDLFIDDHLKMELCCVCHNVCKDAVELSCDVDHDDDSIQLYCQQCLILVISSNDGNCPIDNHSKPSYSPLRRLRSKINKAKVLCPNSLTYKKQYAKEINKSNNLVDTSDEKEGTNNNVNLGNDILNECICNFEGCLSELINHISKCCESNLDRKELNSEIIKLLQNDIKDIKDENKITLNNYKELKNMIAIQSNIINELKKQNQQQNIKMNKLENMIKSQNDLITSMIEEQKEMDQKQQQIQFKLLTKILSQNEYNQLIKWFPVKNATLKLLYRATRDGFHQSMYINKIGNKKPTVCIIQSDEGNVFGGYRSTEWKATDEWTEDNTAFIFLLRSKNADTPKIWKVKQDDVSCAVYNINSYGPIFGRGHAIYIHNGMKTGQSFKSTTYDLQDNSILAGKANFNVVDMEVFHIE